MGFRIDLFDKPLVALKHSVDEHDDLKKEEEDAAHKHKPLEPGSGCGVKDLGFRF